MPLDPIYDFLAQPAPYAWLLTLLMVLVLLWDMRAYIIPNWINGVILLAYLPAAYFMKLPIVEPLIAVAVVLGIGLLIYAVGIMGGGDIKLLSALVIWTGLGKVSVTFLIYVALIGGVFTIFLWLTRRIIRLFWRKNLPILLSKGAPIPYGVAIAIAFLLMLWNARIPSLPV